MKTTLVESTVMLNFGINSHKIFIRISEDPHTCEVSTKIASSCNYKPTHSESQKAGHTVWLH